MPNPTQYANPVSWNSFFSLFFLAVVCLAAPAAQAAYPADCQNQTELPPAQCQALVDLYLATDGPAWADASANGWLETLSPCTWAGVSCFSGMVSQLDRRAQNLAGTLPASLGNLSGLVHLDFGDNQLTGSLPAELGRLAGLNYISLLNNRLSGALPASLGSLERLTFLDLGENRLSGDLPPELGNLRELAHLSLVNNDLSGTIPPGLGDLLRLESLDLGGNRLSGNIPPAFGKLSSLAYLSLVGNQLTGGIPPELGNLTALRELLLDGNPLGGSIPPELGQLARLQRLSLVNTQLDGGIPPELGNLAQAEQIELSHNLLSGPLPARLGSLPELRLLDLSFNRLSGGLPTDLSTLAFLHKLWLSGNALSGVIPALPEELLDADFSYNLFSAETDGSATRADPDWAATQTVPPAGVTASAGVAGSINLSWTPIPYSADPGYYQVWYSATPGGPYTQDGGATADKQAAGLAISGLSAGPYYFVVQSVTLAHSLNQNTLLSAYSAEAALASKILSVSVDNRLLENGVGVVDYGSTPVGSALVKTYTVSNTGSGEVLLDAPVFVGGGAGFTLQPYPAQSLPPGHGVHFQVILDASTAGDYAGTLGIPSDADAGMFSFALRGQVAAALLPALRLFDGALELANGGTVSLGSTVAGGSLGKTLFIRNLGEAGLQLGAPTVSGAFSLANFPTEIPPGGEASFSISLNAATEAQYSGQVSFQHNDPARTPFAFQVAAVVEQPHNPPPRDLFLSNAQIDEGLPAGSLVGILSSSDDDVIGYSLVAGPGDAGNAFFQISGDQLRASVVFDAGAQAEYSLRVQATDSAGQSYSQSFTLRIMPVNHAPTAISLSADSLLENQPAGALIGLFSTRDEDAADTHVYSLASGEGDSGNSAFYIADNALLSALPFDYENQAGYSLRVQSDDGKGGTVTAVFNVRVLPQSILVEAISAGWKHTCARQADGRARCWGWNNFAQAEVPQDAGAFRQVSAGGNHTCALREDGALRCWGNNQSGQARVPGGRDFTQVSAGGNHTCALKQDGSALCWGYDFNGQARPPMGQKFTQISAGGFHTCALKQDGGLECWGWNNHGQSRPPTEGIYTAVSSGEYHACALSLAGTVHCWGKNFQQQASPPDYGGFVGISAGEEHSCALHRHGYLVCWGLDNDGQATPPLDNRDFVQVSAGAHSCAVRKDGNILCWGSSDQGQAMPPAAPPNRRPGALFLDMESGAAGRPVGTLAGVLRAEDLDLEDRHTYTLVAGEGDADNPLFYIEGARLLTARADLAAGEYRIRVEADDGHNGRLAQAFTFTLE